MSRADQAARKIRAREMFATGTLLMREIAESLKVNPRQVERWKAAEKGTIHDWDKLKASSGMVANQIISETQVETGIIKEANTRHQTTIDEMISLRRAHMEDYSKRTGVIKGLTMKALIKDNQLDVNNTALQGLKDAAIILEKMHNIDRKNLGLDTPVIQQNPFGSGSGSQNGKEDPAPAPAQSFQQRIVELQAQRGNKPSDPKVIDISRQLRELNGTQ